MLLFKLSLGVILLVNKVWRMFELLKHASFNNLDPWASRPRYNLYVTVLRIKNTAYSKLLK